MPVAVEHIRSHIIATLGEVGSVLDVGCGNCELVRFLAQQVAKKAVGIDINADTVREHVRSERNGELRTVWCERIDAQYMESFSDSRFDAVVSVHALHEIANADAALCEIRRVLKEGGLLLIADFAKGETRWDEDYFTPGQMRTMLKRAGFNDVHVEKVPGEHFMFATATKNP